MIPTDFALTPEQIFELIAFLAEMGYWDAAMDVAADAIGDIVNDQIWGGAL